MGVRLLKLCVFGLVEVEATSTRARQILPASATAEVVAEP